MAKKLKASKPKPHKRKTIAVAMIVKNEEALLARCLESVKGADAIYIADTGSTDRTIAIARKYTKNVYLDFIWCDDFAAAQNHIKSKVKEDWILSIDADEYLDCDFEEVRRAVALGENAIRVHMDAEGGGLKFGFSRLFRNGPDIHWVQKIHKHLNLPGEGENVGDVRIVFGWSPAHNNDPDRALRILEQVVAAEPEPGRNLYYLGREYWYKRRYQESIATLERYVKASQWPAEKAESLLIMSRAYSAQSMDEEARMAALQAININANFKEAVQWMADIAAPDNVMQWKRMARTASNRDVLWDRVPANPRHDILFLSPHNDDETLFGAFTLMREKPLVVIVTDSYIQPKRGDTGCDASARRAETIEACKILGVPVVFLGIPDERLTHEILAERLAGFHAERIYIPALQGGNPHHDIVNRVGLELFGRHACEQYTTYTKTEPYTRGGWEITPTGSEIDLKNRALECYQSQLALPSTRIYFEAVLNQSEWLI